MLVRHRTGDDVEALPQKREIDHRIARHEVRPEHPRIPGRWSLRHDDGHRHADAGEPEFIAVVAVQFADEDAAAGVEAHAGRLGEVRLGGD